MKPILNKLQKKFYASPLHRPGLELQALSRRISYAGSGLKRPDTRHQPKVFCVGNFKSGTVSLCGLLGQQLRGAHEPDAFLFSKMWLHKAKGQLGSTEWEEFLIRRNNALSLDFEASGFLTTEAPLLAQLYPHSKFILSIREPESWLQSLRRHILKNRSKLGCHYWEPIFEEWFGQAEFEPEEAELKAKNLFPTRGMLNYWKQSNEAAIQAIPRDRLLILETKNLTHSVDQLEAFMGWAEGSLDRSKSHLHRAKQSVDSEAACFDHDFSIIAEDYATALSKYYNS